LGPCAKRRESVIGLRRRGCRHRAAKPGAVSAVNRAISTQDAAAAILYLLFPYDRRSAEQHWHSGQLTLGEISAYAAFITIGGAGLPIPAHARPALLAHLAFRRAQGATAPDVAFFEAGKPRRDPRLLADRALAGTTSAADLRGDDPGIPEKHGDVSAPELLYQALEPATPPVGSAACAVYAPERFVSPQHQQAAFDGTPVNPADYRAARMICLGCSLLAACRRYADDSGDEQTFLAGLSAGQRSARRRKKTEMTRRRLQVAALRELGASTRIIAELVGRDPSLVRGDLRAIEQHAPPAM
jgi:hypothetical protein